MSDTDQIPPASFSSLVQMLATQAAVAMGKLPVPGEKQPEPNLKLAKHFVDLIDVIEAKTKGNLSTDEAGMLGAVAHELRMLYLSATKS